MHDHVGKATRLAIAKTDFAVEEGFIVKRTRVVVPRRRDGSLPPSLRKPENFPPQEIRAAIVVVIERHLGVQRDELAGAVARLLGFKSTSAQIKATFEAQVRKLLKSGILTESEGIVQRTTSANPGTPL